MVKKIGRTAFLDHVFFTGEQRQRDDTMVNPTPRDGSGWTRCVIDSLGGEVDLPPGVVKEEVAVLVVLVCLHCRAVGAAVRRAVDDDALGAFAFEEETGPTAVRRVPPGLLDALRVHALSTFGIAVVVAKSKFTA